MVGLVNWMRSGYVKRPMIGISEVMMTMSAVGTRPLFVGDRHAARCYRCECIEKDEMRRLG